MSKLLAHGRRNLSVDPIYIPDSAIRVCGSHLNDEHDAVLIRIGFLNCGMTELWISTENARAFAAALILAADHYDAETARLAAEAQA